MKYAHNCIKCSTRYEDSDPDAYYCSPCNEEKKNIAKQVDAKMAGFVSKRQAVTPLQEYETAEKVRGFMRVKL